MSYPKASLSPDIHNPENPDTAQKIRQTIYNNPKYNEKLMRHQEQLTERILRELTEESSRREASLQLFSINEYIAQRLNEYAKLKDDRLIELLHGPLYRGDVRKTARKHMAETQPLPPPPPPPPPPPNMAIATMNPLVKRTTNK